MAVTIRDDVLPEHSHEFSADHFPEFADIVSGHVDARRAEWVAAFGPTPYPAKTHEAYERYILPRCESISV